MIVPCQNITRCISTMMQREDFGSSLARLPDLVVSNKITTISEHSSGNLSCTAVEQPQRCSIEDECSSDSCELRELSGLKAVVYSDSRSCLCGAARMPLPVLCIHLVLEFSDSRVVFRG